MHYYNHHIGDFVRNTARLTDSQCMAYLRLIWLYYETESPIENDVDALAFKIGSSEKDISLILKHFFFLHDDGLWHQARCDKEILDFRGKSEKAKKSADARWRNANAMRTHTKTNANAMRTHSERNANAPFFDANQEPITNNQEPITNTKHNNTDINITTPTLSKNKKHLAEKDSANGVAFADFYDAYPKKIKRKDAEKAWKKISEQDKKAVMADIDKRKALVWDDPQYIPAPSTYLNGRRWEDEIILRPRKTSEPIPESKMTLYR